jgi:mono/diheme cytochrome c family protein
MDSFTMEFFHHQVFSDMLSRSRIGPLVLLAGLAGNPLLAMADQEQVEAGAELYVEYCMSCHGENKSGLRDYSGDLQSFTDRLGGLTEEMPDFADFFEEDEIAALHAYLLDTGE